MAIFKACTSFSEDPRRETASAEPVRGSTRDYWIFCACFGRVLYCIRWYVPHWHLKKALTKNFRVPVPYSCKNILGAHAIPIHVSCCKYDGAEPQLDVPSAGIPIVRADR